jgi:hypothetical protein
MVTKETIKIKQGFPKRPLVPSCLFYHHMTIQSMIVETIRAASET